MGFVIGTTEFMAVGAVPEIADDLHTSTGRPGWCRRCTPPGSR
ncbi:hypothetical protein NKH77_38830 [Streptomyces sp. M19]